MKQGFIIAFLILSGFSGCSSCREKGQDYISWEQHLVPESVYASDEDEIEVSYPVAEGPFAEQINDRIRQTILMFLGVSEETVSGAVDTLLSFRNTYSTLRHIPYTIIVNGEPSQFGHTVSVMLNLYQYLGGAHGNGTVSCLSFDIRTGKVRNPLSLFDNPDSLVRLNRQFFQETVPEQTEQLFMPVKELPLPENMLLDSAGLHIFYDPYEIAPYSSGPTEYTIPLDDLRGILRERIL